MNQGQENHETTLSPYNIVVAPGAMVINQQGLDLGVVMHTMENMFRHMELRDRDREARLQFLEARQRDTDARIQGLYREVTDLQRENQELRRRLAAASGNENVNGLESIRNSIGRNNADTLRTTLQAGENAARAATHTNSDSVMRSLWEEFMGLSMTQRCLVTAALAVIIGVVGWAAWTYIVPWVWPKILALVETILANAPRILEQLLTYLSTLFRGQCTMCGSSTGALKNCIETFMNTGFFSAVTYLLPGFIALLLANLESNRV